MSWVRITEDVSTWPPENEQVLFAVDVGFGDLSHRIGTRRGTWVDDQESNSDLFTPSFYKAWIRLPDVPAQPTGSNKHSPKAGFRQPPTSSRPSA